MPYTDLSGFFFWANMGRARSPVPSFTYCNCPDGKQCNSCK